jgi:hypothetical protein
MYKPLLFSLLIEVILSAFKKDKKNIKNVNWKEETNTLLKEEKIMHMVN